MTPAQMNGRGKDVISVVRQVFGVMKTQISRLATRSSLEIPHYTEMA